MSKMLTVGSLGIAFWCALVGAACCRQAAAPAAVVSSAAKPASASATESPKTAADCQTCNGIWGRHGLAHQETCNCRTKDSGKVCRSGNDCQGQCVIGESPEKEVTVAGPPAMGYLVGRCSDTVTVFGCVRLLSKGTSAPSGPVDLSEIPGAMCFD